MAFLAALGFLSLMLRAVEFERRALQDVRMDDGHTRHSGGLRHMANGGGGEVAETELQFEDDPPVEIFSLGLRRDGVLPIEASRL